MFTNATRVETPQCTMPGIGLAHFWVEILSEAKTLSNLFGCRRADNYKIITLLENYGASCANTLYETIRHASFDRRFEKRIQKNVYNLRRISTEFHAANRRRSGSFQDIIFDYQKRGVFSDEFNIIQVLPLKTKWRKIGKKWKIMK